MAQSTERSAVKAALDHIIGNRQSPILTNDIQTILINVLNMLTPFVEDANIRLKSGERISINEDGEALTQINYCNEPLSCADVAAVDVFNGDGFGLREELICSTEVGKYLSTIGSEQADKADTDSKISPEVPVGNTKTQHLFEETVNAREDIIKDVVDKIKIMDAAERAILLAAFGERDFTSFLEQSDDLEQLQSIQYLFTHRINNLKKEDKRQSPRRPVIEQRKVGMFLYKLQATQKGDSYWYIQFTKDGKRVHKYLGKERPSFNPEEDLARTESQKFLTAHS